ncbi:MAG: FtsX-like permease family protein [Actinomycetales bacterium]|nr:FtsX-like permease family protein [Actinomycetales bacterium]
MSGRAASRGTLAPWRARVATRRGLTQWPILLVALTVALVTGSLLAGMSILVNATEQFALSTVLGEIEPDRTRVDVRVTMDDLTGDVEGALARTDSAAGELFEPAPHTSSSHVVSTLYSVIRETAPPAMSYVAALDGVQDQVELTAGSLPGAPFEAEVTGADGEQTTARIIPVLAPEPILDVFGIELGDRLELRGSFALGDRVHVQVTGVFAALEPGGDYWRSDRNAGTGWRPDAVVPQSGGLITTDLVGPLVMDRAVLTTGGAATEQLLATYVPSLGSLTPSELTELQVRANRVEDEFPRIVADPSVDTVQVTTTLPDPLRSSATALTITRASVLVVGLLLLVLAVAALLQAARLVAEGRTAERSLMRARGAAGNQVLALGAVEAIGLAVVTAVASPFLARALYLALAGTPAMRDAGMDRDPGLSTQTWVVAALAAAVFAVVLVSPLLRRQGTFIDAEAERTRPDRKGFLQRSGLDLAVVALAALAYWQLRQYASPLVRTGLGLAIDPLLVVGPALALLAGALLCVRILPPVSRLAERLAARGRGAVTPLAAWEIGRRPARATSAVLLLTLALAVGTFSLTFLSTWRASQGDQAAFATGADARIIRLPGGTFAQADLVADAAGTDTGHVATAARREGQIGTLGSRGAIHSPSGTSILGLDAAAREQLREDFGHDAGVRAALDTLDESAPGLLPGIELPEGTDAVELDVRFGKSHEPMPGLATTLRLAVQDATGLIQTIEAGTTLVTGEDTTVLVDLAAGTASEVGAGDPSAEAEAEADGETSDGESAPATPASLQGPLRIVAAQTAWFTTPSGELDGWLPFFGQATFRLTFTVDGVVAIDSDPADGADGAEPTRTEVSPPGDLDWFARVLDLQPTTATPEAGEFLRIEAFTSGNQLATFPGSVSQMTWPATVAVPLVTTPGVARQFASAGDATLAVRVGEAVIPARIGTTTDNLPSVTPGTRAIAADLTALSQALIEQGAQVSGDLEWWLALPDASPDATEALTARVTELGGTLTSTQAETAERRDSPLRVGVQGVLWLVALGASILAAIGYAVYATVTVRDRHLEFAQLRAIGLQRRSLLGVISRESMLITGLATVFGLGLGALLGWLVAPLISLSPDGSRPVPEVSVLVPWGQIALLVAEVVVLLVAVVVVVSRSLRSADPAQVLRAGDER